MLRTYARIVGVGLVLLGLAGFLGAVETLATTSFFHACVGAFFAYLGFWQRDALVVRRVVGGMGVMLLLVKSASTLGPLLWGGPVLLGPVELTCFVVGVLSVAVAAYAKGGRSREGA